MSFDGKSEIELFSNFIKKLYGTTKNNQLHIDQINKNVMYGKGPGEENDYDIQLRFNKNRS